MEKEEHPLGVSSFDLKPGQRVELLANTTGRIPITIHCGEYGRVQFWVRREDPAVLICGSVAAKITIEDASQLEDFWPMDRPNAGTDADTDG